MTQEPTSLDYQGRKTRRIDGHARRQAILEATLRVIVREGVRGVRHRAVAAEADVPLSATTYYFKDIQDLLNDSFLYWVEKTEQDTRRLEADSLGALEGLEPGALADEQVRARLCALIAHFIAEHVRAQVAQREARVLEFAFKAEALRNERLAAVVRAPRQSLLQAIVGFLSRLGASDPEAQALIVMGTIMELEYQLLLDADGGAEVLERTAARLVEWMFRAGT